MEKSRRTKTPLNIKFKPLLDKVRAQLKTQTTDLTNLINGTQDLIERMEVSYLNKLVDAAPNSLSCFTEAFDLTEPPAEHHEFMCDYLEAIERRDCLRATFSMPPGHAKTKFCTRFFPAWYLGRNPRHRYLQGGHTQSFCESEFGAYVRDIMKNPLYVRIFEEAALNPRSTAAGNFKLNNGRGGYVTKGVGQKIAGFRGHCGGIDDAFGSREDAESPAIQLKTKNWFFADYSTRLLPGAPMFVVATRWNQEDLIGEIEKLNKERKGIPWEIINLNGLIEDEYEAAADPLGRDIGEALWGEYYTPDILRGYKATLPDRDWWSLYKGSPRNIEGNVVKSSWFGRYQIYPRDERDPQGRLVERRIKRVTLTVDTANKTTKRSAYTACLVIIEDMNGRHYLVDVVREKVEYTGLKDLIEGTAEKWIAKVGRCDAILVEDKGNGTSYLQDRRGKAPAPLIAIEPEIDGGKEFRFDAATPIIEAGQFLIPYNATWLPDFIDELLTFPNSRYKDQTDALSQYLNRIRRRAKLGTRKLKLGARG